MLERAFANGACFDSWDDQLRLEVWQEAFTHFGVDTERYLGTLPLSARLPWDHFDIGLEQGFLAREYRKALVQALAKRTLDRTAFSLEDEHSITLVRAKLSSERADEVIFALDLLQRIDHPSLPLHFQELLSHPSADVRFYVLLSIEKRPLAEIADAVSRVVGSDPSARVQAVALRALAALGDPRRELPAFLGKEWSQAA